VTVVERGERDASSARRYAVHAALVLAAVLAPLWIAAQDPRALASSYGGRTVAFELLGFSATIAFTAIGLLEARARGARSLRDLVPLALPLLVGLHYTYLVAEYSRKPFDYDCYEYAARALLLGEDPYRVGLNYLYPPLTAQVFARAHAAAGWLAGALGAAPDEESVWDVVFYLYQCAQLGMILLLYFLASRFARAIGMSREAAAWLVAALLLFDNPLLRTLRHGQVNLWIANLSLVSLLAARSRPALAGTALALAVHVKLYPAVLVLPLLAARAWRVVVLAGVAFAAVVALQTDGLRDWTLWRQFADFYTRIYPGEFAYRNNSFHSLAWNTLRLVFDAPPQAIRTPIRLASSAVSLAMAAWLCVRIAARARAARAEGDTGARLAADGADAMAFSLLISQSVWEHHYVLAIPLAIRAVALRGADRPLAVFLAVLLALGMPTFDLFPFSYHRVVGLLSLLLLVGPRAAVSPRAAAAP
jgi:hypothetical protein